MALRFLDTYGTKDARVHVYVSNSNGIVFNTSRKFNFCKADAEALRSQNVQVVKQTNREIMITLRNAGLQRANFQPGNKNLDASVQAAQELAEQLSQAVHDRRQG